MEQETFIRSDYQRKMRRLICKRHGPIPERNQSFPKQQHRAGTQLSQAGRKALKEADKKDDLALLKIEYAHDLALTYNLKGYFNGSYNIDQR